MKFQLNAGHFVLDFANTLDNRYSEAGPAELLGSFSHLVSFCREARVITSGQAKRLLVQTAERDAVRALHLAIELREALYGLFRNVARKEAPSGTDLETLNQFLAEPPVPAALDWRRGKFAWRTTDPAETPAALLRTISVAAAELLTSNDQNNVRECGAPTCRWLFIDQSRNHSRRWCDMKICGNRAKARKFQGRQD